MKPRKNKYNASDFQTAVTLVLRAVAGILFVLIAVSGWHDVSQAWDSGYYHLPFAARLAGIVEKDTYVFDSANQARFQGFPLLGELLQGILWRVTGRVQAANFVGVFSVPLFAWALRWRFRVPMHVTILALFAIPLVMTHATSCYVDLPANAAAGVVVLLAIEAHAARRAIDGSALWVAIACAAVACNMKALLHIVVALALIAVAVKLFRDRDKRKLGWLALALPAIFFTALKNLALYKNPYFPVEWALFGHAFPGIEAAYSSSPPWLEHAPRVLRFVCSILEIGIRPLGDSRRWSVDQWMPQSSAGNRMGGFFGAYVVFNLAVLAWQAVRDRDVARRAAIGFAIFTSIIAVMPQSHELRYYLSWMIVLVSLNAWLACREQAPAPLKNGFVLVAAASMCVVVFVTRGDYVVPSGSSLAELLHNKVDAHALATVRDGEHVCVDRPPFSIYYAAPFHTPHHYVVQEAEDAAGCGPAPKL